MGKHGLAIEYANNRRVYAPGDIVEGAVVIDLKKPKKIKKIKVNAVGEATVKLKTNDRKQLRSNEKYFQFTFDVHHSSELETEAGKHRFPFRFQLRTNLPTSYEGSLGHVRYSIQGVMEYPGILAAKTKCMSAFTVLDTVDLNHIPSSRQPQRIFCEKKASGMCFWKKAAVTMDITTEKTGYVPGEFIIVNGIIANGRSKPIRVVKVNLQQQVTFSGRDKSGPPTATYTKHVVTNSVASWNIGSKVIEGESTENWQHKQLMQIPPLISTGLRHCTVIDVQYFLRVLVIIPGSVSDTEITGRSNYLTIGTIPLMASPVVHQPAPVWPAVSPLPSVLPIASAPPPADFQPEASAPPPYDPGSSPLASVPLPSYEEAVTGGASLEPETQEENEEIVSPNACFTPQYAFFDYSQPAFNPAFSANAQSNG